MKIKNFRKGQNVDDLLNFLDSYLYFDEEDSSSVKFKSDVRITLEKLKR